MSADKTTDLVAELRAWREPDGMSDDAGLRLMQKAADEIERLRAERDNRQALLDWIKEKPHG